MACAGRPEESRLPNLLALAYNVLQGRVDPSTTAMMGTPSGTPMPQSRMAWIEFASNADDYYVDARPTTRGCPMSLRGAATSRRVSACANSLGLTRSVLQGREGPYDLANCAEFSDPGVLGDDCDICRPEGSTARIRRVHDWNICMESLAGIGSGTWTRTTAPTCSPWARLRPGVDAFAASGANAPGPRGGVGAPRPCPYPLWLKTVVEDLSHVSVS